MLVPHMAAGLPVILAIMARSAWQSSRRCSSSMAARNVETLASVGLVLFSLMVSRTPLASGATTGRQRQNELSAADAPDQVRKKTGLVKPGNRGQVEDDSSQEDELERWLHGLVAELLLGDQRAGPPSEKVCKVEAGFRGALRIALRRDLVRPVH